MIALIESILDVVRVLVGNARDEMLRYVGLIDAQTLVAAIAGAAVAVAFATRRARRPLGIPPTPAVAR